MVISKKQVKIGGVGMHLFTYLFLLMAYLYSDLAKAEEKPIVTITQSVKQVWQRQQILITVKVDTKDPFARLESDDFYQKGFSIIPYPLKIIEGKDEAQLILRWAVFPFVSGDQKLQLPSIIFRPNRGRKQRLRMDDVSIQIKKLPLYVPPTMPVGHIILENKWDNGTLVNRQELLEWRVNIKGENVAAETMPPLSRQLLSTDSVRILPVQHEQKVIMTEQGIMQQRDYTIPIKALSNGRLLLPELAVQFFDPKTGRLSKASIQQPLLISLDRWIVIGLILLLIFIIIKIILKIYTPISAWFYTFNKRRYATKLLTQAENYQQVRSAINQLSLVEGWGANLSLTSFFEKWQGKYGHSIKLEEKVNHLQSQYFSN